IHQRYSRFMVRLKLVCKISISLVCLEAAQIFYKQVSPVRYGRFQRQRIRICARLGCPVSRRNYPASSQYIRRVDKSVHRRH
ncbi:PIPO, partial [Cocksfoot streak virus]|uniref:PIPO n=1 Tax=Cocksfoot streak virus TaxID=192452 RepID=UPI0002651309